ncbi:ribulose-phosphate 3-epimerase [soil metagenome]
MTVRINPSILSADFVNLQAEVERVATADALHVDVMDNHFVPNLTFGPQMVRRLHDISPVPLDVHLMIDDVDRWAPEYAELGAFSVTFHAEATENPVELARHLRKLGARAGLALKPGTSVEPYLESLHEFDQVLVMTVEPGFGGQSFIEATLPKITAVRQLADTRSDVSLWVQVDGGVSLSTIGMAAAAGADTFVAGSSVYNADDPAQAIASLRATAEAHPYVAS